MTERAPRNRIAAARSCVRQAGAFLTNPRTCDLERCEALLGEARRELEILRQVFRETSSDALRKEALDLRCEIRQAGALLEQAARFGRQWLDRLGASEVGYTAAGTPAPVSAARQILVAG